MYAHLQCMIPICSLVWSATPYCAGHLTSLPTPLRSVCVSAFRAGVPNAISDILYRSPTLTIPPLNLNEVPSSFYLHTYTGYRIAMKKSGVLFAPVQFHLIIHRILVFQ